MARISRQHRAPGGLDRKLVNPPIAGATPLGLVFWGSRGLDGVRRQEREVGKLFDGGSVDSSSGEPEHPRFRIG